MRIPTLRQQLFGDIDKQLNARRTQMNREIREQCFEALERKKELRGGDA
jgi:hypothetical protein